MIENDSDYEGLQSSSNDAFDSEGMRQVELDFIAECVNPPRPNDLVGRIDDLEGGKIPKAIDSNPQIAELIEPIREEIPPKYPEAPSDNIQIEEAVESMGNMEGPPSELSPSQKEYLNELFLPEGDWNNMSDQEKAEIRNAIEERIFEIIESENIDLEVIQKYIPEYLSSSEIDEVTSIERIDELCENAEQLSMEELREVSPELANLIDRMQERLGNNCPDGIMNTFEYFKTADGTIIVRSNNDVFRNSHIIVKGSDAYCIAGDRNDDNHLNEFINEKKLMANFTYHIDGHLTYKTDDLGRVVYIKEEYINGQTSERSSTMRQNHQQDLNNIRNAKDGRPNGLDHAGHLVAYDYNGPTEGINIVPMSKELNKGDWRNMENKVKSAIDNKSDVILEKYIKYEGESYRPTAIDVTCTIDKTKENYYFDNK